MADLEVPKKKKKSPLYDNPRSFQGEVPDQDKYAPPGVPDQSDVSSRGKDDPMTRAIGAMEKSSAATKKALKTKDED